MGDSGGVVNSLDFCPASLKSLGCFYFRCVLSSQWKSERVWQQARTCCSSCRMPQNAFFPQTCDLVSQKMTQRHFFHPPSPFPGNFCNTTVVAFVPLCNSRFNFHCYTQHEATPTQKSAQKRRCDLSQLLAQKITKGIHSCKPASLNRPIGSMHFDVHFSTGTMT